ncbi:cupredoxin domain-containing protein [Actinospica durhamensis]|uniref:cupredoxin domain-containing protein n=1 Tax=Actinospica durhamensis TaxID=1508375 RepID=UPI0027DBF0FB|nr:cupredoxin domain-containing protein [Actinospica durhamensis]
MYPSRRSLLAAFGGSVFLLGGCSSGSGSSSSPTTGTGATGTGAVAGDTITIQNFAFSPATLTVAAGSTVTVTNKDSVTHTVTSSDSPKAFNTGDVPAGTTTTFTAPSKAGTYAYTCTIHPYMHGTLTVQ